MSVRAAALAAGYSTLLRPLLFASYSGDPEKIHEAMIHRLAGIGSAPGVRALVRGVAGSRGTPVTVAGIRFPGRVGVAAGLDKDGLAARAWAPMGFGFAELGTVTASAQPGNPKPRVYRLRQSGALINRMGFNNAGAEAMAARLRAMGIRRGNGAAGIPLGISIGKTKAVPVADAVADYVRSMELLCPYADYVAVNVSSPNTPGLRTLQTAEALSEILRAITEVAVGVAADNPVPIFVKIAPDLADADIDAVLQATSDNGGSGVIATNTTITRDGIAQADRTVATQEGGLSGPPLTRRAREVVSRITATSDLPVMASGGIMTAGDARAMFDAGAKLVQVYTGFIYAGPGLVAGINALDQQEELT